MFEVAKNADIQNQLSVEIENMFERTDGNPDYTDIAEMRYLDAVINGKDAKIDVTQRFNMPRPFLTSRNATHVSARDAPGTLLYQKLQNETGKIFYRTGNAHLRIHIRHPSRSELVREPIAIRPDAFHYGGIFESTVVCVYTVRRRTENVHGHDSGYGNDEDEPGIYSIEVCHIHWTENDG